MDLWLQKQESGSWSLVGVNRGYEDVGTPNPGKRLSRTLAP